MNRWMNGWGIMRMSQHHPRPLPGISTAYMESSLSSSTQGLTCLQVSSTPRLQVSSTPRLQVSPCISGS